MDQHPLYCFVHCYPIDGYEKILDRLLEVLESSGLKTKMMEVFLNNAFWYERSGYTNIEYRGNYEEPTLNHIRDFSREHRDAYILYLHTKGVTRQHNWSYEAIRQWMEFMLYFNCNRHQECITAMDHGYDTVGANYIKGYLHWIGPHVEMRPHWQGNFWWAKASYLSTLPDVNTIFGQGGERFKSEQWVFENNPRFVSLCQYQAEEHPEVHPWIREEYEKEPYRFIV